jgi:predicted house-cleaning NTP pyrophosphatase (Maf/HAM1 superfamily)
VFLKSNTLKLGPILAKYLHENKKLNLSGIGSFSFDSSWRTDDAKPGSQGIYFQSKHAVVEDQELIQYISANTGKMKPLAAADLESYLELAKQFLNIGKPFYIEGIGTLVKIKSGDYEFTGDYLPSDRTKETGMKELSATSISDESLTTYESLRPQTETAPPYRRIFLTTLIVITAGIIIYLGYRISRTPDRNKEEAQQQLPDENQTSNTASAVGNNPDSGKYVQATDPSGIQQYRFVIETATKRRAYYRYHFLKDTLGLQVNLSTADSVIYKIFFVIKATPGDTSRIADSLTVVYPAQNRRPAFVEKQ